MEYDFESAFYQQALSDTTAEYIRAQGPNVLQLKSYAFAVRMVNMCDYLESNNCHRPIVNQILRSGTSIGANIHEAEGSESKAQFGTKMSISLREAKETRFWINLLLDTKRIDNRMHASIANDCDELIRLLVSTVKTVKPRKH